MISETTEPYQDCSYTVTKSMPDAAVYVSDTYQDNDFLKYSTMKDWVVDTCSVCGYPDMETLRFAYSDYEAAYIMLGYVNDLKESVYGTDKYNLVLNDTLMELAKIRAKELSVNFSHGGTFTNASENIAKGPQNIRDQFNAWCNSTGHYNNMIYKYNQYFGYAIYRPNDGYGTVVYGVQLFWNETNRID